MGKVTGFLEYDRVENKSISPKRIVEWYDSNPPITNKGTID